MAGVEAVLKGRYRLECGGFASVFLAANLELGRALGVWQLLAVKVLRRGLLAHPGHASWFNQIEICFSLVQRKALTPNDFRARAAVEQRLLVLEALYNDTVVPFRWRYTRHPLESRLAVPRTARHRPPPKRWRPTGPMDRSKPEDTRTVAGRW